MSAIGITAIFYLGLIEVLPNEATIGSVYLLLIAKLIIVLSVYGALARRYFTVTLDKKSE